jgi:diguanylate cyclase (GGDEF)-like protein
MRFKRLAKSIVTRLLLVGICLVLVGSAARYFFLSDWLREDLSRIVSTQQEMLASYVAKDVEHKITERSALLHQLAQTLPPELLGQPDALRQWLDARYRQQPLFSQALLVTDPTGQTLAQAGVAGRGVINPGDADYIRTARSGTLAVGRPAPSSGGSNLPVLPMAVPIQDASGQVRAVLVGVESLAAADFLSLTGTPVPGSESFLVVSPKDQLFVASTYPGMVMQPTPAAGVNLMHDRAMSGFRGSGQTVNAFGVEEIAAMHSVPSTGWFVVARVPTAQALSFVSRTQNYLLANVPMVVAVFLLLATGSLMAVFRPLFRAADHADRMTRGELPLAPLPVERDDEVGHLTHAFNRLLAKLQASQAELQHLAHHDVLTGLPNRVLLASRLTQVLARAKRNGTLVGVLYLDLDGFKPINDSLGHASGDAALIEVARRLAAIVRAADTLARVGGDEFMVLLEDMDPNPAVAAASACAVAVKCLEVLQPPLMLKGEARSLGLSIGLAVGNGQSNADALRTAADAAMYQAKQAGGRRYVVADITV